MGWGTGNAGFHLPNMGTEGQFLQKQGNAAGWASALTMERIWVGADAEEGSAFAAQTIPLTLQEGEFVMIISSLTYKNATRAMEITKVGDTMRGIMITNATTNATMKIKARSWTVSTEGIAFEDCHSHAFDENTYEKDNVYYIPREIYVIRGAV